MTKEMKNTLWYASIAAMAGILFGYDTAVISGAIKSIAKHFSLNSAVEGWAVASALVGSALGAALSGIVSDRIGRKRTLVWSALCYTLSALGSAIAPNFHSFWLLRMLGGVGIGFSAIVPMYIGEIATPEHRGKLSSLYQLAITMGILVVAYVNYLISEGQVSEWLETYGWRWMIGSETLPAVLFLILVMLIPESPRWLVMQERLPEARKVCSLVMPADEVDSQLQDISASIREDKKHSLNLGSPGIPFLLFVAIGIALLQQAVGINVIIYYGTSFLYQMGIGEEDGAFQQVVVIMAVNFAATFLGIACIDRFGRKPLLTVGAMGVMLSILLVGFALYYRIEGPWLLVPILLYIVFFAAGLGPIPWVVLGELAPSVVRAEVLSIGTSALWMGNILVSFTFPIMRDSKINELDYNGSLPFFVYGFFAVLFVIFAVKVLPETRKASLEELSRRFQKEE